APAAPVMATILGSDDSSSFVAVTASLPVAMVTDVPVMYAWVKLGLAAVPRRVRAIAEPTTDCPPDGMGPGIDESAAYSCDCTQEIVERWRVAAETYSGVDARTALTDTEPATEIPPAAVAPEPPAVSERMPPPCVAETSSESAASVGPATNAWASALMMLML